MSCQIDPVAQYCSHAHCHKFLPDPSPAKHGDIDPKNKVIWDQFNQEWVPLAKMNQIVGIPSGIKMEPTGHDGLWKISPEGAKMLKEQGVPVHANPKSAELADFMKKLQAAEMKVAEAEKGMTKALKEIAIDGIKSASLYTEKYGGVEIDGEHIKVTSTKTGEVIYESNIPFKPKVYQDLTAEDIDGEEVKNPYDKGGKAYWPKQPKISIWDQGFGGGHYHARVRTTATKGLGTLRVRDMHASTVIHCDYVKIAVTDWAGEKARLEEWSQMVHALIADPRLRHVVIE